MKVSIVGGGPAGLYLGILLAKADAGHDIEIVERNAPDATFGWGVVFSGETLGALREADLPTYLDITDSFARWDAVDVRYQGRLLRSRGHTFAGIARRRLLAILQGRCRDLGVRMRFETEVADPAAVGRSADLVVAADGANSGFRRRHAEHFGTVVAEQGGKYAWFGTDLVLDAFRFIFAETEHGLFQVHSYPYDESTSTFIVECAELVWRRAGLDVMTEAESIRFCEQIFADDLAGHRLMSNRSVWLTFPRVSNRTWRRDNVVLLGDAAHTAHFSIGSGTKLAMEDAIALAAALTRHAELDYALADYEIERRPVVERVQRAADESVAYFSRVGHHTRLDPLPFTFNLLTRSGRISHANLTVRDPAFTQAVDAWHAGLPGRFVPPPTFTSAEIGPLSVRNRAVLDAAVDRLGDLAGRGAGLVLTEFVAIGADARITPETPVLDSAADMTGWRQRVTDAHAAGCPVMVRLGHAGRRGATQSRRRGVDLPLRADAWPLLSASAVPYGPRSQVPQTMTAQKLTAVREAFAAAAELAADAGFDALELDAAHGYLLASFLSPLSNHRDDEYGGTLPNRMRFLTEVLAAVRERWPDDRLLAVRLTIDDWARGGLDTDEGVTLARAIAEAGAQLIHVQAGQTVAGGVPDYRRGYLTTISDRVRNEADVATLVGGYLTTLDEANTILAAGRADLCRLEAATGEAERRLGS